MVDNENIGQGDKLTGDESPCTNVCRRAKNYFWTLYIQKGRSKVHQIKNKLHHEKELEKLVHIRPDQMLGGTSL